MLLHFYIGHLEGITVLFETGLGNNRKLINMTEFGRAYTEEYRAALLVLPAYCGCDSTSAFKGQGHVKPIRTRVEEMQSTQEETEPRIVIDYMYAK